MDENIEYKFKGVVERCLYNSPDYRIYAVKVDKKEYPNIKQNSYNNVSIMGEIPELSQGVEYEIVAKEQVSKYGMSYKVLNIRREVPKTSEEMFCFLEEILTYNQATTLYSVYPDIVERVKENRLDDIDLNKLKGIKKYTFEKIKNKIIENYCLADLVIEFQGYFSLPIIKKIYNKYSSIETLKEKLKSDPYKSLCGLAGVSFKTADSMLLDIEKISKDNISKGKSPIIEFTKDLKTSSERCLSCLLFLLEENENEGHTKMNLSELREGCMQLVPSCSHHFIEAIKSSDIYYNKETMDVSLRKTYDVENYIAKSIIENIQNENVWNYEIEKYRDVEQCKLSDKQMNSVSNVCKYNISILNGSAGTGKSFSTKAIINMLKEHNKTFLLLSPTGKASRVISNYTGEKAKTIHRGLGYIPPNTWTFNNEHKINCDIVIVDEFSMVDIFLFKRLIDAIDFKYTKLLLIGDDAQLPSVGCGNLLHDFIETKLIPTTTLSDVFRYGEGGLMKVATDVRMSKIYLSKDNKTKVTTFGDNKDYTYIDLPSEQIPKNAVALYKKLLDNGCSANDVRVLTAKNVGDCGVNVLNNMLQKVANHNYGKGECIQIGETSYYESDLVIQKVNNYEAEIDRREFELDSDYNDNSLKAFIANGETGVIEEVYNSYAIINFDGIRVKYTKENMNMVGLGYAMTIHKSQGSSIDNVILCTPQSHIFMLNSNLIYVGLTRMKKKCFHFGDYNSVNKGVKKKANFSRHTFMQQLLISLKK